MVTLYLFINQKTGKMRISPVDDQSVDEHQQSKTECNDYTTALTSCKMYALGLIHGQIQANRGFRITSKEEDFI